jgi:hypothetical protein
MVSLYPSPNPPPYTDTPLQFLMDPYHPFAPPHPSTWPLDQFCRALHRTRTDSSQRGILSVQHWKRVRQGLQHESLILDVVPLVPGRNVPLNNPSHTYIQLGRFKDREQTSLFGIWGLARDEVVVVGREAKDVQESKEHSPDDCLSTISWAAELPNLVDVFDIIQLLSLMFPYYNIVTRQCYWFARTIYNCLRHTYGPYREDVGKKGWKRSKFMLIRFLTPSPPSFLLSFCRVKKVWSEDATVGHIRGSAESPGGEGSSVSI